MSAIPTILMNRGEDAEDAIVNVVEEVDLRHLATKWSKTCYGRQNIDDSFYICDLGDVVLRHRLWFELFPRVQPYFSTKACPYDPLIRCLMAMGTGFGCTSVGEIEQLLEIGVKPANIIFYNPWKQPSHILYAKAHGIRMLVADTETELLKLKLHYPSAEVLLRMKSVDPPSAVQSCNRKFGVEYERCRSLLEAARNLQLVVVGVSFHIKSGYQDPPVFTETLRRTRKIFDYAAELGFNFTVLNIGGGFAGLAGPSAEKIADTVRDVLNEVFPPRTFKTLRIIALPGRYYPSSAFALVTQVVGIRRESTDEGAAEVEKTEYVINDGIHGAFSSFRYVIEYGKNDDYRGSCATFRQAYETTRSEMTHHALDKPANSPLLACRVWGSSSDDSDLVLDHCHLPDLNVGDWILWENAGAYTLPVDNDSKCRAHRIPILNVISDRELNLLRDLSGNANVPKITFRKIEGIQ